MDKRELGQIFRERLEAVLGRFRGSNAKFAESVGLDRSALSQLLSGHSTRLPRAETLRAISQNHHVSLDWLLGLSQDDRFGTEVARTLEIEEEAGSADDTRLAQWHAEAAGYKIRYVPATLPDLLRTDDVIRYEHRETADPEPDIIIREAGRRLAYSRRPETDMEVCMPMQRLQGFARGEGVWSGLTDAQRTHQIRQMAGLLDELYPTFRIFLYDGREAFSAPYTVFGPLRAAIYVGDMYLVLNGTEQIAALTSHFDRLIKRAVVNPHEAGGWVRGLLDAA
ncbi:MAG: helix-turn-helix domain-containing protein [Minwuia sp.]|uniref:helix-turn-helix domain-containing protein n=1 Tax=Minwuia sp. TaxID=2493630 RepID=UPI003A88A1F4